MKLGSILPVVIALVVTSGWIAAAQGQTVRYLCTNDTGAPDRVEVDFDHNTVLDF
jgi:hypothetical protein